MPTLELVDASASILQTKIEPSKRLTKTEKKAIANIRKTLAAHPEALAIAANQVGVDVRAFVFRRRSKLIEVINPEITWTSFDDPEEIVIGEDRNPVPRIWEQWEMCMSFPGKKFLVTRPYVVRVTYSTLKGSPKQETVDSLIARMFLHEVDHLDGIIVPNRASDVENAEANDMNEVRL